MGLTPGSCDCFDVGVDLRRLEDFEEKLGDGVSEVRIVGELEMGRGVRFGLLLRPT